MLLLTWRTSVNHSYHYSTFNRSLHINLSLSKMQHWHQIAELQQRLWNWYCRGMCRLPAQVCANTKCFRERIKKSVWKWDQIIQCIQTNCSSSFCQTWGIWMCLNIWLMGHHLLSDYSRWILWVKLHLWQFITFQLYSSLEWKYVC